MKHIVTGIIYRNAFGTGTWYDSAMIPGTATIDISQSWNDNGSIIKYNLSAVLSSLRRIGESSLEQPLCLIVSLEDGSKIRIGTPSLPCWVETTQADTLQMSCSWSYAPLQ